MNPITLFAAAAACGADANCCPLHAIAAVVVSLAVGFAIGRLTKRGGKCQKKSGGKGGCGCAKKPQAQGAARGDRSEAPSRPPIPAGSVEIYVGNLSYDLGEDEVRKSFEEFGAVSSVRLVTNRFNDRSKGFGFVVMPNRDEAEKAIAALNDKEVLGRRMRVNEAKNTVKEQ